jgi:microcystin-dependent protein
LELTGQAVSRTTYSGLFALLGTSYGAGDGTTTFNVPDYRGRTLVGQDASQTEFDVLGEAGGAKTHTLTGRESGVAWHTHQMAMGNPAAAIGTFDVPNRSAGGGDPSFRTGGPATGSLWGSTLIPTTGQAAELPHNNLQPYTVVKWIICAASSSGNFDTEVQTALVTNVSTLQTGQTSLQARDGLVRIIPQSIAVNAGSGAVASTGTITFNAANTITLSNVFTDNFDRYLIVWQWDSTGGAADLLFRLMAGATSLSALVYDYRSIDRSTNGLTGGVSTLGHGNVGRDNGDGGGAAGEFFITNPNRASRKKVFGPSMDTNFLRLSGLDINSTAAHDGIQFFMSNGATITNGRMNVYAYAN